MSSKTKPTLTRRQMVRAMGLTVAASGALIDGIRAGTDGRPASDLSAAGLTHNPLPPSLFLSCAPPGADEDGPKKYHSGDTQAVLPLVAFWVMLTTDNWDSCFNQSGWINDLVAEFARENPKIDQTAQRALSVTMNNLWNDLKTGSQHAALVSIRTIFKNASNVRGLYGGRPCPGGGTILDIVGLVPKTRP